MRILLYYFSGTGITAYTAAILAEQFRCIGHHGDLVRYKRETPVPETTGYDLVGIGSPAYAYYPPRIFISALKTIPSAELPFFLFVTSHSAPGITAERLYRVMRRKGYRYIGPVFETKGINNIRSWREKEACGSTGSRPVRTAGASAGDVRGKHETLYHTRPAEQWTRELLEKLTGAEAGGNGPGGHGEDGDAACSRKSDTLKFRLGLYLFTGLFSFRWQMAVVEGLRKRIDEKRCTGCGLCVRKICPSGALSFDGKTPVPVIRHRLCVGCSGCVNLCPEGAVTTAMSRNRSPYTGTKGYILDY